MLARLRRALLTRLWDLGIFFARRRRPRPRPDDFRRLDWPTDTRRIGVRANALLRERMRPRWLRLIRPAPRDHVTDES